MSHFTVAVFTQHGTEAEVDKLLLPFCEDADGLPHDLLDFVEDADCDIDEETGKSGYWTNPNAYWDWYQIGGRWTGLLLLKPGRNGAKGERAWCAAAAAADEYDTAKVEDIDFEAMQARSKERLTPFPDCFERKFYKPEYFNRMYPSEDIYIRKNTMFSTYAVLLPDGSWIAPGKMGWFGCSSDNPEGKAEFIDTYHERFIKPAIENGWYITIVDCHI